MYSINNVKQYIGVPYKYHGRTDEGMDCYGLIKKIYRQELDIDIKDFDYLERVEVGNFDAIHEPAGIWRKISVSELQPFDLLVFKNQQTVGQICIFIGDNNGIFTLRKTGSFIARLTKERMRRCIGVYRWVG